MFRQIQLYMKVSNYKQFIIIDFFDKRPLYMEKLAGISRCYKCNFFGRNIYQAGNK